MAAIATLSGPVAANDSPRHAFRVKTNAATSSDKPPCFPPRRIGPLNVSPMGLGTWSWGNRFLWGYSEEMDAELQSVFNYAIIQGTGRLNGRSESLLGQFVKESSSGAANIHIATKFAAYPWRVLPANIVAACRGSLRRLDMETLSLGQLHWSAANYAPFQDIALQNGLAQIYEKGLVRAIGVSNYGPIQLRSIHDRLQKRGVPLHSAQSQFSLLSYGPQQRDLKQVCDELGIVLIAYSPLALGILTDKFTEANLPRGPRGALFRELLPKVEELLACVREIAKARERSAAQVAINWCICKGTMPIPGVKNMAQAVDNLGAIGWSLSEAEVLALDDAASASQGKMVQNIFQTG